MSETKTSDKPVRDLEKVIASDRYQISGFLDRGCWGAVYKARDTLTDKEVAIKVLAPNEIATQQMADRKLDPVAVMKRESAQLAACANVVPRILESDKDGKLFVAMPLYSSHLASAISDHSESKKYLDHGLSLNQVLSYARDIANGLFEVHSKLSRTHGDLKPDNLALDNEDNILINDLGASSLGNTGSPRDNIGFIYTRAPECFKKDSHPSRQSDVWAFGSIAYRLFTGKYILEDELENAKDPELYISQLDSEVVDKLIQNKIKRNVPKPYRKLLAKSLAFKDQDRIKNGQDLKKDLEQTIDYANAPRSPAALSERRRHCSFLA